VRENGPLWGPFLFCATLDDMMSRAKKEALALLALLVVVVFGVSLFVSNADERTAKPTPPTPTLPLRFGITVEPTQLCHVLRENAASTEVLGFLQMDLIERVQGTERAGLATHVPRLGVDVMHEGDGMRVHWRLRQDVRWSDGAPVVADDFVRGLEVLRDERVPVLNGRDLGRLISTIDVDADHHGFVVHLKEPVAAYLNAVPWAWPAHRKESVAALCAQPLSNGPYVLTKWQRGQWLELKPNPYAPTSPNIKDILIRIVPSTDALVLALRAGEIDATFPVAGLASSEAAAAVEAQPQQLQLLRGDGTLWVHIDINLNHPILSDVRVRRALRKSVDWDRLVAAAYGEGCTPGQSFLQSPGGGSKPDLKAAETDFHDAGWFRGANGIRELAGEPLRVTLLMSAGQRDSERFLALVQEAWRGVGVDVQLEALPFATLWDRVRKDRSFDMAFFGWNIDDAVEWRSLFHSSRIPSPTQGGMNVAGWRNKDADNLTDLLRVQLDPQQRTRDLSALDTLFVNDIPSIGVCLRGSTVVVRRDVKGVVPTESRTPLAVTASSWTRLQ
jgi:peptide/nickel transport system substrate-binding protein